jgi:hypothetical protein
MGRSLLAIEVAGGQLPAAPVDELLTFRRPEAALSVCTAGLSGSVQTGGDAREEVEVPQMSPYGDTRTYVMSESEISGGFWWY